MKKVNLKSILHFLYIVYTAVVFFFNFNIFLFSRQEKNIEKHGNNDENKKKFNFKVNTIYMMLEFVDIYRYIIRRASTFLTNYATKNEWMINPRWFLGRHREKTVIS